MSYVNGQNGHFYTFLIYMASLSLGLGTFCQKVIIPTITFLIPAVIACYIQ